jgi:CubicO group peptidase (beta-lactamase class C family)
MVDAVDSKSTLGNQVLVRVRPSAIFRALSSYKESVFYNFMHLFLFFLFFSSFVYADESMIEDYIIKSLDFWNVPGASIAIVKNDQVVLAKGFGYIKREKAEKNKVTAETLFPIASLTKPFSAIATGIFAQQQQISLDSTIQSLWPSFKLVDEYATRHITLRDCLSMRAGLMGKTFEGAWWNQPYLTGKKLLEDLSQLSFPCGFRGCFAYQNLLYNIASDVIEIHTGKSWEVFVKEHVLDKLAMDSTTTSHDAFLAVQNKAFPHQWKEGDSKEVPFERLDVIAPGAGLSSNANDMAKWLKFILDKNGAYSSLSKDTVTPQTVATPETFFTKEEAWLEKVFFPNCHFLAYGMGWFIHDYDGLVVYQTPGLTDGMNGLMAVIPELDLGVVILSNLEAPFFSHSLLFHSTDYYRNKITDWDQALLGICKTLKSK